MAFRTCSSRHLTPASPTPRWACSRPTSSPRSPAPAAAPSPSTTPSRPTTTSRSAAAIQPASRSGRSSPARATDCPPPGSAPTSSPSLAPSTGEQVVAWYDDGHVGVGERDDLRGDARPEPFVPAPGRTSRDLAAVVVTPAGEAIALYHDGETSFGTLTGLAAHGRGRFDARDPASIDALALAPDGRLFAVHRDVSVDVTDLDVFVRRE